MSRYIDADALKKRVSELIIPDWTITLIRSWLDSAPTVDAVPVEWIKNHIREQVECDNRTYAMEIKAMLDWYMLKCADGERKEKR